MFPDVGIVLSTRERTETARRSCFRSGVTMMSAGSHTEPGGYTGAGKEKIHHTERGQIVELARLPANGRRRERQVARRMRPASSKSPTNARRRKSRT